MFYGDYDYYFLLLLLFKERACSCAVSCSRHRHDDFAQVQKFIGMLESLLCAQFGFQTHTRASERAHTRTRASHTHTQAHAPMPMPIVIRTLPPHTSGIEAVKQH